ncbi:hypothetical protein K435DRAFT_973054 [Dendrothele bispora CBS 962.96]|uniref:Glutathione S-transferase n=1 Tax=Dendrothele bispora (strain CBS 962.96) TaxID=1314807 RepID=A0A4S8KVZ7_DENBC|nr:hypothetical protein K435DRAFT_973054 [Dendrothele bispora CBS 962.96]
MAAPTEQITLYTAKICPYAQRTEIALAEAGVDYTRFEIDLGNKPEWYASKINPASKPTAAPVPASQPSPLSTKLAESLVLLEFLSDIHPTIPSLLPRDPVKRARARFFIDAVSTKFVPAFYKFQVLGEKEAVGGLMEGVESVMRLLPSLEGKAEGENGIKEGQGGQEIDPGPFVLGPNFSIADAAIAPFALRWELSLSNDIGAYEEGEGMRGLGSIWRL